MDDRTEAYRLSITGEAAANRATTEAFRAEMAAAAVVPLWDRYNALNPVEPRPVDKGFRWSWKAVKPLLERAARDISMEDAERRVLMLINPNYASHDPHGVSTTGLYGALQILLPGEMARPHRHTLAAYRFVMEGSGAVTVVNGKECPMLEGDLILTPSWTWHEHTNNGFENVTWFNGLDVPLLRFFGAGFNDHGSPGNFPPDQASLPDESFVRGGLVSASERPPVPYSPLFRYAWTDVKTALAAMPAESDGSRRLRYVNPMTGGAVMPTMDLYALDLAPGRETRASRTTSNAMCIVVEGEGETIVGDNRIAWQKGDVFTLALWTWISHKAGSEGARLFLSTDRELLRRLELLRDEFA
jgi:gentisate 1,2-dioxygenase